MTIEELIREDAIARNVPLERMERSIAWAKARIGIEIWTRQLPPEEIEELKAVLPLMESFTNFMAALPGGKEALRQIQKEIEQKMARANRFN
jgi:hypothetical protein